VDNAVVQKIPSSVEICQVVKDACILRFVILALNKTAIYPQTV